MTPFKVLVMDTNGVYSAQPLLLSRVDFFLDLGRLRGIRYMCSPESLERLQRFLPNFGRTITFLGDGECHHLSLLFLKRQREPFTLVVLDSHFDFREESGVVRCDGWLANVLALKKVKRVILFGCRGYEGRFRHFFFMNPPLVALRRLLNGEWIYLSVDKDVLRNSPTKWGGGEMDLEELMNILKCLPKRKITGIDICGEPDPQDLLKLRESERLNLMIVDTFLSPPHLSSRDLQVITSR